MINEFKKTVKVFDLPCGSLMRTYKAPFWKTQEEEDKSYFTMRKKKNEELLKATEDMTDEAIRERFAERCKGLHTHLAYFSTIADTAIRNKWVIGYATYRKRMKKEDIEKEHRSLLRWIKKNGKDTMTAISIGLGKRGYVYVFFVSTSADGVAVGDIGTAFYQNRRKKGYAPIECRPFEKNPYTFLEGHYCTPLQDDMELTTLQSRECACLIRSSFALHGKHKTLKTRGAIDNLYNYMYLAEFDDMCNDIGGLDIFEKTHSLLGDWVSYEEDWEEDAMGDSMKFP